MVYLIIVALVMVSLQSNKTPNQDSGACLYSHYLEGRGRCPSEDMLGHMSFLVAHMC